MPRTPCSILILCLAITGCDLYPTPSNVKIRKQSAEGLSQSSFDHGYLQQLVNEALQGAEQRLRAAYERNNIPADERSSRPQANGRYEWFGPYQLAVIDLSYSANPMRVVRVVGIEGDQLITISCIAPNGMPIDIVAETGECAEAIAHHFKLK